MHKSPLFGHSVEFVQHREYVPGDDIRHLDWKVWSKTDRYYIKMFEEETNLRCTLVVDVSESMHYGRGPLNKYNYACTIAACLGYLLLRQQDAVGLISFDSGVRQIVPSRSQQTHIDALINALDVSRPREKTDLERILRRVTETTQSRGMIIIVSDLLAGREPLFRGLEMLSQRRHDILIFHVLDDDELAFPFAGSTRFEGMEELPHLLCDPRACATAIWKPWRNTLSRCAAAVPGWGLTTCRCAPATTWTLSCPGSCTTACRNEHRPKRGAMRRKGLSDASQKRAPASRDCNASAKRR